MGGTKDPDVAAIVALAPDLVVVDREENRREDAEALQADGLAVHVTDVTALAQVPATLAALAEAVGIPPPSPTPARPPSSFGREMSLSDISRPTFAGAGDGEAVWARAFVPIWRRPWMSINGDTYGSTLLAHLGVLNVLADVPDRYPTVDLDAVVRLVPELVLLPSEPYGFRDRHVAELAAAMPSAEIVRIDGRDLFWWGVLSDGAVARLRDALRPGPPPR